VGEGREDQLQKDVSGTIEAQVARLIDQARVQTESKVKIELKQVRDAMLAMDAQLDQLLLQLEGMEVQDVNHQMDVDVIGQLLSKLEETHRQEIRTLKQELHQTILAHNHNADLIKHHKDTIDALTEKCQKLKVDPVKTYESQQHLQELARRLKQQQLQRKLEPLHERITNLEQRVVAAAQNAWRGYPTMPLGMSMPLGIPPAVLAANSGAAPTGQSREH
jgi:hypothetical protein